MKRKKNKSLMFTSVALGLLVIGVAMAIVGMSSTLAEISEKSVAKTPDAILASTGLNEDSLVSVPVIYYDQRSDECVNLYDNSLRKELVARQFEWTSCGYHNKSIEGGLVNFELSKDYLPVAAKGALLPNRGIDMDRWFSDVEGKSKSYNGVLKMQYKESGAEFLFEAEDFYPLDETEFSVGDIVNDDGHNHLFTMNFAVPFTVLTSGKEEFKITADDDTFVFVGDKLAIDMGGIHDPVEGRLIINESGEVYSEVNGEGLAYSGVNVEKGEGSIVRIFHADRDSEDSTFNVEFSEMNLSVTDTKIANGDGGVQIAYDPSDPTYVAPLGESLVFRPDSTKGLVVMLTIEGVMVVVVSVLVALVARFMIKQKAKR